MRFTDYVEQIAFRCIQPQTHIPRTLWEVLYRMPRLQHRLEQWNTVLPEGRFSSIHRLLRGVPRMSSLVVGAIIHEVVRSLPHDAMYLNIGTWHGYSLFCGMLGNPKAHCVGVDNFSEFGNPREEFLERFHGFKSEMHAFYEMDYEQYFSKVHSGKIGCFFYDGNHSLEHHRRSLELADPFIVTGGLVIVDDTNDDRARQGVGQFLRQGSSRYRTILDIRTACNRHPTYWNGLMILQKQS